jgi:hypothetical protein
MTKKSDNCFFENSASDLGSDLIHQGPRDAAQRNFLSDQIDKNRNGKHF